jgi:hypothetical protein
MSEPSRVGIVSWMPTFFQHHQTPATLHGPDPREWWATPPKWGAFAHPTRYLRVGLYRGIERIKICGLQPS